MDNSVILRRLIWKDVVTIRPLFFVIAGSVIVFNLLCRILWPESHAMESWATALWLVLPHVACLGSAAMLIGSEEDGRTMDWLRTLPVSWTQVAASKFLVAFANVIACWAVASIGFFLIRQTSPTGFPLSFENWRPIVLAYGFFSCLMLTLGFCLAYAIRSSLIGLILLLPLTFLVTTMATWLLRPLEILGDEFALFLGGLSVLVVCFVVHLLLARRRMTSPAAALGSKALASLPVQGGPRISSLPLHRQPSQIASLLWQQFRQTSVLCVTLLALSVFLGLIFSGVERTSPFGVAGFVNGLISMTPVFILIFASWFGAIAFYGDTQRRRCVFFADRGISPTQVWWTRMLPPTIAFIIFTASIAFIMQILPNFDLQRVFGNPPLHFIVVACVLFAYGQLASQWIDRPLLAFLAAPAICFTSLSPFFYVAEVAHASLYVMILVVPVLLFATWILTKSWLENRDRTAYTIKLVLYTGLAVLLPCLWVIATNPTHFRLSAIVGLMP
ncbi:MAG: ABC transporter permease [Rubripirellula sp.]